MRTYANHSRSPLASDSDRGANIESGTAATERNAPNRLTAEHAEDTEAEEQRNEIPRPPFSAWSAYSAVESKRIAVALQATNYLSSLTTATLYTFNSGTVKRRTPLSV